MPIHHVPRASLHEDLIDITRKQGEHIEEMFIDPADPDRWVVRTTFARVQTRPMDGAA